MNDLVDFWLEHLPAMLDGLMVSVQVTGVSLAIGVPLGLLLALAVQSRSKPMRGIAIVVVEVGRGAPALILLQFTYFGLPNAGLSLDSFSSAVIALAWCTGAYTSEIIRAGLEAVPHGQKEAAEAIGLNHLDALRYVILPQALRVSVPALLGFSILMLQASSLCFAIALPELVSQAYLIGSTTFRYMPILVLAGLLYAAICIPATIAVSALERKLGAHA
ncbi:polar amino acid transport system permease protein [Angulomicrobium tetraedrale]|uniref:Polar amino acid transport system permease protein n=1 Tax=Ancylobacter tetraedralis TaxID=217068 RepID=A0A839Z7K7_9HYPH|nr:amino acid ABC transporter permease [Ancylobacter tetraedralis]MBB3770178.1 polar amino acid transport system permease protein [Ancylobacter tetraedralis]